jgi:hypothetical protein
VADKAAQLLLRALSRAAAAAGEGVPLHGNKAEPGLFAPNTLGRQAAQRGKDEGYLRVVATQARGKGTRELCAITDKGLAFLLSQSSPKHVLEDFLRVLEARQGQVAELLAAARQMQASLAALHQAAEKVFQQLPQQPAPGVNGSPPAGGNPPHAAPAACAGTILEALGRWQQAGASEDCPLPELYRQLTAALPEVSLGQFHDALRRLQQAGQVYLHPWTGPLYALPEPPCALLSGHEVAYYASLRA